MTEIPQAAIAAARDAIARARSQDTAEIWLDANAVLARVAVAAAAPPIAAAERERIRQLAIRNGATCTSDEGTGCYFADLLTEPEDRP